MNTNTEILQIVNLAMLISNIGFHKVVVNFDGEDSQLCAFIYPKGSQAPIDYLWTAIDKPDPFEQLSEIRKELERVLASDEAKAKMKVAA